MRGKRNCLICLGLPLSADSWERLTFFSFQNLEEFSSEEYFKLFYLLLSSLNNLLNSSVRERGKFRKLLQMMPAVTGRSHLAESGLQSVDHFVPLLAHSCPKTVTILSVAYDHLEVMASLSLLWQSLCYRGAALTREMCRGFVWLHSSSLCSDIMCSVRVPSRV